VFWDPIVFWFKAFQPIAVLLDPDVLKRKAEFPIAVLWYPVVFAPKALHPIAVLLHPVVFKTKEANPIDALWHPVVLLDKALPPAAKLSVPVAEELKFVVEPIEIFVETFPPPKLTNKPLIEPVTPNDPVIKADPVYGNVVSGAYEALKAFVANEAVVAKLELIAFKT